jgi:hypothetical protein
MADERVDGGAARELEQNRLSREIDKLEAETDKLKAETQKLVQPAWKDTTKMVTIATVFVAVVGAGFQYKLNDIKADRAVLEFERAEFNKGRLRDDIASLERSKGKLLKSINEAKQENEQIERQAQLMRDELRGVEQALNVASQSAPVHSTSGFAIQRAQEAVNKTQEKVRTGSAFFGRKKSLAALQETVEQIEPARLSP